MKCPYCNHADTRVIIPDRRRTALPFEEDVPVTNVANALPHMKRLKLFRLS